MFRDDTIAAIATAPGNAGIGIIRISGPQAADILSRIIRLAGHKNLIPESHRMSYGWIMDGEEIIDECMTVFMQANRKHQDQADHQKIQW